MTAYDGLLDSVVEAANRGADFLKARFDPRARPADRAAMYHLGAGLEAGSVAAVREVLDGILPSAGWFDDEEGERNLPPGEWWIVDGAEGGVNHVHGLPEWAVTIALVKDGVPQLSVVRQPVDDLTYMAVRGTGAWRNGEPLRVSAKTDLDAAIAGASQAGNSPGTHARFGRAVAAMSDRALLVRNTVPTTFPLLRVAAGQSDIFWQYEPDLPGTAAGTLLATEAGALVSDLSGKPWDLNSADILVAAPGVHAAALEVLSS
ncbi:inositol monophosphatase [Streptomyces sp. NPDC004237]|uniref:inositol monophosphatase family protein n=1 Tax=Streptomyces sp. NPDC004237 TaxID=3154455 RepID=UPI0033BFAE1A